MTKMFLVENRKGFQIPALTQKKSALYTSVQYLEHCPNVGAYAKTLSGRQKKILLNFYQIFTSSLSMYMEFKSVGIFVKSIFV